MALKFNRNKEPMTFPLAHAVKLMSLMTSPKTFTSITNWEVYLADSLGLLNGEYTLRLSNDLKITLPANSPVKWPVQEILLNDDYRLLAMKNDPPRTIIDLGASIGVFSLSAKHLFPQAKVFAFEPEGQAFRLLQRNIAANRHQRGVIAFPLACYSQQVVDSITRRQAPNSNTRKGPAWVFSFANAISLENIFSSNNIHHCDLLKIDVEGAEYDILYSLSDNLYNRIKRIHLEYHNLDPTSDLNGRSLKRFLETKKYRVIQDHRRLRKIGMLFAVRQRGR